MMCLSILWFKAHFLMIIQFMTQCSLTLQTFVNICFIFDFSLYLVGALNTKVFPNGFIIS